jgi:hypothetical protein
MNTFFVSTNTQGFCRLLQSERAAKLFIETIYHYRAEGNYLLHEFVVMVAEQAWFCWWMLAKSAERVIG